MRFLKYLILTITGCGIFVDGNPMIVGALFICATILSAAGDWMEYKVNEQRFEDLEKNERLHHRWIHEAIEREGSRYVRYTNLINRIEALETSHGYKLESAQDALSKPIDLSSTPIDLSTPSVGVPAMIRAGRDPNDNYDGDSGHHLH